VGANSVENFVIPDITIYWFILDFPNVMLLFLYFLERRLKRRLWIYFIRIWKEAAAVCFNARCQKLLLRGIGSQVEDWIEVHKIREIEVVLSLSGSTLHHLRKHA